MAYPTSAQIDLIRPQRPIRPIQPMKPLRPIEPQRPLPTQVPTVKTPWAGVYLPAPNVDPRYNKTYEQRQNAQEYKAFMAENEKRSSLFFDYDNKAQVNSLADVIIRSTANMTKMFGPNAMTIPEIIAQFAKDSYDLAYYGAVAPLLAGDSTALKNNFLVNMSETMDIIDNTFYKSFVVGGKKYGSAAEGFRQAFYERENFDFDTGNKAKDLALEIFTPWQIAKMVATFGASTAFESAVEGGLKKMAKEGGQDAVTKFSRRQIKHLSRAMTNGSTVDEAMQFAQKAARIDSSQIKFLQNLAVDTNAFKVVNAMNMFKLPMEILDDAGPKLFYKSAFAPMKVIFKGGAKAINPVWKAAMRQLDNAEFHKSFSQGVMNIGDMKETYTSFTAATADAGSPIKLNSVSETIKELSYKDINSLREQVRKFTKAMDSNKLLNQIYEEAGELISSEAAQALRSEKAHKILGEDLDALIQEISGGVFKTFDEYTQKVSDFYVLHPEGLGAMELFEVNKSVRAMRDAHYLQNFQLELKAKLKNFDVKLKLTDGTLTEKTTREYTQYREGLIQSIKNTANELSGVEKQIVDLNVKIKEPTKFSFAPKAKAYLDKISKEYRTLINDIEGMRNLYAKQPTPAYKAELREMLEEAYEYKAAIRNAEAMLQDSVTTNLSEWVAAIPELEAKKINLAETLGKFQTEEAMTKTLRETYALTFGDAVKSEELLSFLDTMSNTEAVISTDIASLIKTVEVTLEGVPEYMKGPLSDTMADLNAIYLKVLEAESTSVTSVADLVSRAVHIDYEDLLKQLIEDFDEANFATWVTKLTLTKSYEEMAKTVLGEFGDLDKILTKFTESRGAHYVPSMETILKEITAGEFGKEAQSQLIETLHSGIGRLDDLLYDSGVNTSRFVELSGTGEAAKAQILFLIDSLTEQIDIDNVPFQSMTPKKVADVLSKVIDDLVVLREYAVLLLGQDAVQKSDLIDAVDEMISAIPGSKLYAIEYSTKQIKEYVLNLPSYMRTRLIMNNETIESLLEDVATRNKTVFSETIKTLSDLDTHMLLNLQNKLNESTPEALLMAQGFYAELTGKAMPDSVKALEEVTQLLTELNSIKDAANYVQDTLEGMNSHKEFMKRLSIAVESGRLDKEVAGHFYDAMHSFYTLPADLFDPALGMTREAQVKMWKNKIIENVSNQLRSSKLNQGFKLEKAQEYLEDAWKSGEIKDPDLDDFFRRFPTGAAHTANADAEAEYLVEKLWLKDPSRTSKIHFDLETGGLNPETTTVHQAGMFLAESKQSILYLNVDIPVVEGFTSDNLYLSMYSTPRQIEAGKYTLHELKQIYKQVHNSVAGAADKEKAIEDAVAAFRNHFGMADEVIIIPAVGEKDLLEKVSKQFKELTPPGAPTRINMFNGRDYDLKVLNARMRKHELPFRLRTNQVVDTLKSLEDANKVKRLSAKEQHTLSMLLDEYVSIRQAEINTLRQNPVKLYDLNQAVDDQFEIRTTRNFMPSIDKKFRDSIDVITGYVEEGSLRSAKTIVTEDGSRIGSNSLAANMDLLALVGKLELEEGGNWTQALLEPLKDLRSAMTDVLDGHINTIQDTLGEVVINTGDMHKLLGDEFWENVWGGFEMSSKGNVSVIMKELHAMEGLGLPVINVKTRLNSNALLDWFEPGGRKFPQSSLDRMKYLAKNLDRNMENIRDTAKFLGGTENVQEAYTMYNEMSKAMLEALTKSTNMQYFSPILTTLKETQNVYAQYAIAVELYAMVREIDKSYKSGLREMLIKTFGEQYPEGLRNIMNPKLLSRYNFAEVDTALFWQYSVINDDAQNAIAYLLDRLRDHQKINLAYFEEGVEKNVKVARLQRLATVFEPMIKSFENIEKFVDEGIEGFAGGDIDKIASERARLYAVARMPAEAIESYIAYNKLNTVLNMNPEEMVSYMWNWARGEVTFNLKDLRSSSYFVDRNQMKAIDYIRSDSLVDVFENLMANKKEYEALGIIFDQSEDRVIMSLSKEYLESFKKLKFTELPADYSVKEYIQVVLRDMQYREVKISPKQFELLEESLNAMAEARDYLQKLTKDGATSTLEMFDDATYEAIRYALPDSVKKLDLQDMLSNQKFDGNSFNHSVLGSIDSRRELMEFASYNPAKVMFSATQMLTGKMDTQMQFAEMMFSDLWKLSEVAGSMKPEEILQYFQDNRHLKLAFLHEHPQDGFRMAAVNLYGVKDIEWAMKMGAVVMDYQTYVKTYEIINKNMLPVGIAKVLSKYLVVPLKVGWMAHNYATVLRNLFDSGMKNVISADDVGMFKYMANSFKSFFDYKYQLRDIIELIDKPGMSIESAIELYYETVGKPRMPRELWDRISEFKISGTSEGMTKELAEFYGDAVDRLYRNKVAQGNGSLGNLTKKEFREFVLLDDKGARAWLDMRYILPSEEVLKSDLMNIRSDRYFYKRSYEMHKVYRGKDLSVDDIYNYIKLGRVPANVPDAVNVLEKLKKETRHVSLDVKNIDKIMHHPLVANSLTANGAVEEVMRLAMYNYMLDNNFTTSEALSEVIRTHFDYGHRTKAMMYAEIAFPFSTFRYNSILYWVEELNKHPHIMKLMAKTYKNTSNIDKRDPMDIIMRRNLQYQMFSGNVIVNKETGMSMKLNQSVVDMFEFFSAPFTFNKDAKGFAKFGGYLPESFNSFAQQSKYALTLKKYSYETEEEYAIRKYKAYVNLIPLAGPQLARLKAFPEENIFKSWLLAPLLGKSWTPELEAIKDAERQRAYKERYRAQTRNTYLRPLPKKFNNYTRKTYKKRVYPKKNYPAPMWDVWTKTPPKRYYPPKVYSKNYQGYKDWSNYSAFNQAYYSAQHTMRRGSAYPSKSSRSLNYAFSSMWRRSMTKKGNPKYKFISFPTNKWTLQIKIQMLRNITSYNRWQ